MHTTNKESLEEKIAAAITDPATVAPRRPGETAAAWSARAVVSLLTDTLVVRPCHVAGMHEPDHHARYMCGDQKSAMLDALLASLGLNYADLPRRLHDGTCGWCHRIPGQEEFRARLRTTYQWAGAEIPPALAEPAPDAPQAGDADLVLRRVTAGWRRWPDVLAEVEATAAMPAVRIGAALRVLEEAGAVETRQPNGGGSPDVRLHPGAAVNPRPRQEDTATSEGAARQ